MARVNIDDWIETRPEFWRLLEITKNRDEALGKIVRFFRLAQSRYGRGERVTHDDLCLSGLECMIDSGWAKSSGSFFECIESSRMFGWYRAKIMNGKAGGRPKAGKNSEPNEINEVTKPTDDLANPLAPAPVLVLDKKNTNTHRRRKRSATSALPRSEFDSLAQEYPRSEGRTRGVDALEKRIKTREELDRFAAAMRNYIAKIAAEKTERKYIKHFSSFVNCWQDYEGSQASPRVKTLIEMALEADGIVLPKAGE